MAPAFQKVEGVTLMSCCKALTQGSEMLLVMLLEEMLPKTRQAFFFFNLHI